MGYLSNTSITIDAILTKKGRELLAQGGSGGFNITQFALGDDEIDYTLWNSSNDQGSNYYGEAIENLPMLEAFPDENAILNSKLVSLPKGTSTMPVLNLSYTKITLNLGQSFTIQPKTLNYTNINNNQQEPKGYIITVGDARLLSEIRPLYSNTSQQSSSNSVQTNLRGLITFSRTVSKTVNGVTSLGIQATTSTALFTNNATKLTTTLTITGVESGARITIPIVFNKSIVPATPSLTV